MAFQRRAGLNPDGYIGQQTRAALLAGGPTVGPTAVDPTRTPTATATPVEPTGTPTARPTLFFPNPNGG
ncbi:peptidoglycan-binding protein [Candidatus Frankia alpina]|uniref:peptidoglycan-binding protein n=1 Tax=Candidatus Frankia alpina TaxID=2699483 RepID=UPI003AF4E340